MWTLTVVVTVLALVLLTSSGSWGQCVSGSNCKPPDCRCWGDPQAPGNFYTYDTPQMVIVTFTYGVTSANAAEYKAVFQGLRNPNGCEPRGTFFVQELNTDFSVVRQLFDEGHEIGITSQDGKVPRSAKGWTDTFAAMKAQLNAAGVPANNVQGIRAPELYLGGDAELAAMQANNLTYDSTCTALWQTSTENFPWPFTYDFVDKVPVCSVGSLPLQAHPGKWQFLVADFEINGRRCATPSGCRDVVYDSEDAFNLFYDSYIKHYGSKTRPPFVVNIDPLWLAEAHQAEGTREFLEFVRAAFDDTWILTNSQALAWIRSPVDVGDAYNFEPWSC